MTDRKRKWQKWAAIRDPYRTNNQLIEDDCQESTSVDQNLCWGTIGEKCTTEWVQSTYATSAWTSLVCWDVFVYFCLVFSSHIFFLRRFLCERFSFRAWVHWQCIINFGATGYHFIWPIPTHSLLFILYRVLELLSMASYCMPLSNK